MTSCIRECKTQYIDLLNQQLRSSDDLHETVHEKKSQLLSLAKSFKAADKDMAEPFFTVGYFGLENADASEAEIDSALESLKTAAKYGHIEAGLVLYQIFEDYYTHIDSQKVSEDEATIYLGRALSQKNMLAIFLKAKYYSDRVTHKKTDDDPLTGYDDADRALHYLDKLKQGGYAGYYLLAGLFFREGIGGGGSNIMAVKTWEEGLAKAEITDLFVPQIIYEIKCYLARSYWSGFAGVAANQDRAIELLKEALKTNRPDTIGFINLYELDGVHEKLGLTTPETKKDDAGDQLDDSTDKQKESSPMKFFSDPDHPKAVYNKKSGKGNNKSPFISRGDNGYAVISHPEDNWKPPIRVRLTDPDESHTAMREKIMKMDTLDDELIEELMEPLDHMPGLKDIKQNVIGVVKYAYIMKKREAHGLKNRKAAMHMVFSGNPGTGKTHVARLIATLLYQIGILDNGHMIEAQRNDLVGEYIGWSESKTNLLCQASFGGVLFIDEAYTLAQNAHYHDFGPEVIATLLKMMEDYADRFVVIAAGYKDKMEEFVRSNPGLRSRFAKTIEFRNYTTDEMIEIMDIFAHDHDYVLNTEAREKALLHLKAIKGVELDRFGNARGVRNLFDDIIRKQADRLIREKTHDREAMMEIKAEDIPATKPLHNGSVAYLPDTKK